MSVSTAFATSAEPGLVAVIVYVKESPTATEFDEVVFSTPMSTPAVSTSLAVRWLGSTAMNPGGMLTVTMLVRLGCVTA
jgi:hypothetical protein